MSSSIRIGTSGYTYPWNEGRNAPFKWYTSQGFNSVEINASFYRFPTESWLKIWRTAPEDFTFSIKVHRSITHFTKLKKDRSFELWERFRRSFEPLEDKIDFWLFQMPPSYIYKQENLGATKDFFEGINLGNKAVVEFRDPSWWKIIKQIAHIGVVFCSVDAPGLPDNLAAINNATYLRLHGSDKWYDYVYSQKELDKILLRVKKLKVDKKAIYLNNDHGMLKNGRYLLKRV